MIFKNVYSTLLLSCLFVASCGGGGGGDDDDQGIVYSGARSQASVTAGNVQVLAVSATIGADHAVSANFASSANPLAPKSAESSTGLIDLLIRQLQQNTASKPLSAEQSLPICDSGSATLDQNNDGTEGSIDFSNCRVTGGNGETLNGRVTFGSTVSGSTITSLDMRFINFRVSLAGTSETINMTVTCSGSPLVCRVFSDFVGFDGRIYRVDITLVTITGGSSYVVDAIVFDPAHGFVEVDATLNFNGCVGAVPETGSLVLNGAAGSTASILFNDCDSFTVTHLGVPTVYFWADIL